MTCEETGPNDYWCYGVDGTGCMLKKGVGIAEFIIRGESLHTWYRY